MMSRHMDTLSVSHYFLEEQKKRQPGGRGVTPTSFHSTHLKEKTNKPRLLMIHEALIALTDDPRTAAILRKLLYWSREVTDFELFAAEEKKKSRLQPYPSSSHGWFEKSDQELIEEFRIPITTSSLHHSIDFLVKRGWVRTRVFQIQGVQKTQYRVNVRRVCADLDYDLPHFLTYGIGDFYA